MEQLLRTEHLNNDIRVEFIDASNRYFGDYYRLHIEIRCRIAITPERFSTLIDPDAEADLARSRLGDEILWVRHLERMGVSSDALDEVRQEMIESFVQSTFPYLQSPQFATRAIALALAEGQKRTRPFRRSP